MLLASVLVSFSPRDSRTAPHHAALYMCIVDLYVVLLHDCLAHSLRAVIAVCIRFTECSIEFSSFNICARWIVFMRWIGFMIFSVLRTKRKKKNAISKQLSLYIYSYMARLYAYRGVCVHVLQGIQSAQKHRAN